MKTCSKCAQKRARTRLERGLPICETCDAQQLELELRRANLAYFLTGAL